MSVATHRLAAATNSVVYVLDRSIESFLPLMPGEKELSTSRTFFGPSAGITPSAVNIVFESLIALA